MILLCSQGGKLPLRGMWVGVRFGEPCPPPGDLPDTGIKPSCLACPTWAGKLSTTSAAQAAHYLLRRWHLLRRHLNEINISSLWNQTAVVSVSPQPFLVRDLNWIVICCFMAQLYFSLQVPFSSSDFFAISCCWSQVISSVNCPAVRTLLTWTRYSNPDVFQECMRFLGH